VFSEVEDKRARRFVSNEHGLARTPKSLHSHNLLLQSILVLVGRCGSLEDGPAILVRIPLARFVESWEGASELLSHIQDMHSFEGAPIGQLGFRRVLEKCLGSRSLGRGEGGTGGE
jgi:hypothetical protein